MGAELALQRRTERARPDRSLIEVDGYRVSTAARAMKDDAAQAARTPDDRDRRVVSVEVGARVRLRFHERRLAERCDLHEPPIRCARRLCMAIPASLNR